MNEQTTETLDKLFLEIAQFTNAKTPTEIGLWKRWTQIQRLIAAWIYEITEENSHIGLDLKTLKIIVGMLEKIETEYPLS